MTKTYVVTKDLLVFVFIVTDVPYYLPEYYFFFKMKTYHS